MRGDGDVGGGGDDVGGGGVGGGDDVGGGGDDVGGDGVGGGVGGDYVGVGGESDVTIRIMVMTIIQKATVMETTTTADYVSDGCSYPVTESPSFHAGPIRVHLSRFSRIPGVIRRLQQFRLILRALFKMSRNNNNNNNNYTVAVETLAVYLWYFSGWLTFLFRAYSFVMLKKYAKFGK